MTLVRLSLLLNLLLVGPIMCTTTKKVLSFGGNGFIGSETLSQLFEEPDTKYSVTLVSRGNWYFDSKDRIKPKLANAFICDREDSDLEYCEDLMNYIKENDFIDIVLDFSAYKPEVLEATLEVLQGKVGLYVYISSDSVYEVCKPSPVPGQAKEEDAIRPESEDEQDALNDADSYGHEKLAGEEILRDPKNKIPYVIFRLADVLGPRDNTDRWWTYQMWIQFYQFIQAPIPIPTEVQNLKTSYVYVKDVAQAIRLAIQKGDAVANDVYNLAMTEQLSLRELLDSIAQQLNTTVQYNDQGDFNLFPSVTRGGMFIDHAKTKLGFKPTPWSTVVKETVEFYKNAFYNFNSERDDVAHQLTQYVIPRNRKGDFLMMVDRLVLNPQMTVEEYIRDHLNEGRVFEEMGNRIEL